VIPLISRPTQFGGQRWYFVDENGRRAEKLYFVQGRFVSRAAGRLTYRSQSLGVVDRIMHEGDKLQRRIQGSRGRGPARGNSRAKLERRLKHLGVCIEHNENKLIRAVDFRRAKAREARQASKARLEAVAKTMVYGAEARAVADLTPVVDKLKERTPKIRPRVAKRLARAEAFKDEARAHVDIGTLCRLGYLKDGEVLGDQLGWSEPWLTQSQQLFFLIDARQPSRTCAVSWLFDVDRNVAAAPQLFWLHRIDGAFGRQEYRFVCPETRRLVRKLLFVEGRFVPLGPQAQD
jgi:hypothetical protein